MGVHVGCMGPRWNRKAQRLPSLALSSACRVSRNSEACKKQRSTQLQRMPVGHCSYVQLVLVGMFLNDVKLNSTQSECIMQLSFDALQSAWCQSGQTCHAHTYWDPNGCLLQQYPDAVTPM